MTTEYMELWFLFILLQFGPSAWFRWMPAHWVL